MAKVNAIVVLRSAFLAGPIEIARGITVAAEASPGNKTEGQSCQPTFYQCSA